MSELLLKEDRRGKNKLCKKQGVPLKKPLCILGYNSTLNCAKSKSKGNFENYIKVFLSRWNYNVFVLIGTVFSCSFKE